MKFRLVLRRSGIPLPGRPAWPVWPWPFMRAMNQNAFVSSLPPLCPSLSCSDHSFGSFIARPPPAIRHEYLSCLEEVKEITNILAADGNSILTALYLLIMLEFSKLELRRTSELLSYLLRLPRNHPVSLRSRRKSCRRRRRHVQSRSPPRRPLPLSRCGGPRFCPTCLALHL